MERIEQPKNMISVCIAAYNDENTIEQIIRESVAVLNDLRLNFEIIVLDDCSRDDTARILERLKASLGFLKVISHEHNRGYGVSIKELLYSSSGEMIFTLPGDFQIPPQALKKMLSEANGCEIVIGCRNPRKDPLLRKINSIIYNRVINSLFHIGVTDVNSSKLINAKVIRAITLVSDGPFIDAELCAKAVKNGFKIKEVDIEHKERMFGSPSGDKLQVMWKAFKETLSMIGKI